MFFPYFTFRRFDVKPLIAFSFISDLCNKMFETSQHSPICFLLFCLVPKLNFYQESFMKVLSKLTFSCDPATNISLSNSFLEKEHFAVQVLCIQTGIKLGMSC